MKASLDWLKDFVDIEAPPDEVAHRLTMAGLEVEGSDIIDGDTVFEVNVTPNRPDCLSILGIAREVAAAFNLPLKLPGTVVDGVLAGSGITVEILAPNLCHRYTGRLISGVTVGDTPAWVRKRIERCGIRSLNNNVVDITNYVLLELGHPLHAFDAERLFGGRIRVAQAGRDGLITTLDGVDRKMPEDALLIWDGQNPVAVAGIMGGEESSVTVNTKNIFLESAYFYPASVRRTSKKLGLRSESSYRFERGTDIEFLVQALNRASLLMLESGGGSIHEIVDAYPVKYSPRQVRVGFDRINSLLGTELSRQQILDIMGKIGVRADDEGEVLLAYPPAYRRDISEYYDIVEEVARIHGYGNIPVRLPRTSLSRGVISSRDRHIRRVGESIRKTGFSEVINYSFMNPADLDILGIPADDVRRRHITVMNPLRAEDSLMRTTLVPSLLNNFVYNISRGVKEVRLYEIARVYLDRGKELPEEGLRLGGIFFRESVRAVWKEDAPAFYVAKGALEAVTAGLRVTGLAFVPSSEVFLHRGKSADLLLQEDRIGFVGEISPSVIEKLNLKISKPEIVVFEIDLDRLLPSIPARITYAPIPKFPAVERDIAMVLDDRLTASQVLGIIKGYDSEIIEKVELFDFYKGKNIPGNKKSLAFRITYRSPDRTLTETEVESTQEKLVAFVLEKTGGELRGA